MKKENACGDHLGYSSGMVAPTLRDRAPTGMIVLLDSGDRTALMILESQLR
jgi:hypothetical protein